MTTVQLVCRSGHVLTLELRPDEAPSPEVAGHIRPCAECGGRMDWRRGRPLLTTVVGGQTFDPEQT